MRHIVEIKFPKLFGNKKKVVETEVVQEANIEEVLFETKKQIEETSNDIKDTLKVATPFAIILTVGYVLGYNRGLVKGIFISRK